MTILYKNIIIVLYAYQRRFAPTVKPPTSATPYFHQKQTSVKSPQLYHPSRIVPCKRYRLLLTSSDNLRINTHTPAHLHKTAQSLIDILPLQYPNINIIVLGDLQDTIASNILHHMGYQLPHSPHNILI